MTDDVRRGVRLRLVPIKQGEIAEVAYWVLDDGQILEYRLAQVGEDHVTVDFSFALND